MENTTEALPQILTELLQKGFEFVKTEDIIYTENYRIDNTGKQIFEPVTMAINPVVIYSDDPYANVAFEKMRLNLTLEEIYNLSTYGQLKIEVIEKNQTYLSNAEIAALQMMSYEELYAAYIALVYAAETYGTADYNPNETTTTTVTSPEVVETTPVTSAPETTIYDKTDITYPEKTDVTTTVMDKTDITNIAVETEPTYDYGDKTETQPTLPTTTYYDKTEPVVTDTTTISSETTMVSSTTTTMPPETTQTSTTTSQKVDVQGESIIVTTTTDPKG